jgi:hypothetical protein
MGADNKTRERAQEASRFIHALTTSHTIFTTIITSGVITDGASHKPANTRRYP